MMASDPSLAEVSSPLVSAPTLPPTPASPSPSPRLVSQITNVSELKDVSPDDWAYQALQMLTERYGCISGYPNQTFRGDRALSRWEFAAGLNACLNKLLTNLESASQLARDDLALLKRLQEDFKKELAPLTARVDNLESRLSYLEDHNFSPTSKIFGNLIVQTDIYFSGETERGKPQVTNQYNLFLANVTSFTGRDTLLAGFAATNTTLADVAPFNSDRNVGATREGTTYAASAGDLNNNLQIITLQYQFPIGESFSATIVPVNRYNFSTSLLPNFVPDYQLGFGPVSSFAVAPPIYLIGGGVGGSVTANLAKDTLFSLTYLTPTGSLPNVPTGAPNQGVGLFAGDYIAAAQLNYNPDPGIFLQLLYQHGYFAPGNFAFNNGQTFRPGSGYVGTSLANRFDDPGILFNDASSVVSNAYGVGGYYAFNPQFSLGGWVNYIQARLLGKGDAEIWTYSLQAIFPDLFREGNLGGLVVGVEPMLTGLNTSLPIANFRNDTSLHIEAFYRYQIARGFAITPFVMWITAPNQDANNQDLVIGGLRTNFAF
ncbi:MAG: iron uptake porin [Snowella sp.]|nr:iron uptake porin [Snowella sp.]